MHAVWWRTTTLWKSFLRPASSCRDEEERGWGFSGYKVTHTRMLGGKFASSLFLPSHRDDGNVCILSLKNSTIFTARATFVLLPAFSSSFSVCRRRHGVRELFPHASPSNTTKHSRVAAARRKSFRACTIYCNISTFWVIANRPRSAGMPSSKGWTRVLGGKVGANRSRYDAFLTLDCILNFLLSRREASVLFMYFLNVVKIWEVHLRW